MSDYTRIIATEDAEAVTKELADQVIAAARAYIQREGLSQGELARKMGVSPATLSAFLKGTYEGDWKSMALDLDYRLQQTARMALADSLTDFVETGIAKDVFAAADMVMERGGIALIHGDSGMGKTAALRRVERETQRCVFISAATAKARMKGLLLDIGERMHRYVRERSTAETFNRTADGLRCFCKLLIVDEIHKYCGRDECFDVLRDLYDATNVPQLWSGTTDLIRYFDRKIGQGREPLAQIRRRIVVARDLNDLGGFSTAEIRKLLAPGRHKLDPGAVRYMVALANLKDEGGLGLVKNLYATAATLATASHAAIVTADMLRTAHGFQVSQRTRRAVESKLASEEAMNQACGAPREETYRERATA